jgi:hypothetical protein
MQWVLTIGETAFDLKNLIRSLKSKKTSRVLLTPERVPTTSTHRARASGDFLGYQFLRPLHRRSPNLPLPHVLFLDFE